jgi:hypothetical protein
MLTSPPNQNLYRFCLFLTKILTVCVCTLTVGLFTLLFNKKQEKRDNTEDKTMNNTDPTLPSNRAFVVQFRTVTEQASDNCAGRVEHLVSGQAVRFDSWEHLQHFMQEILAMLTKVEEKPP